LTVATTSISGELVEPAIVLQVSHDEPSRYAIPLIHGSVIDVEWVSIDAVDLGSRVDPPDGSANIAWAATEIQRANGLVTRKSQRQRDQLEILASAPCSAHQPSNSFMATNCASISAWLDGRRLHLGWLLCWSTRSGRSLFPACRIEFARDRS
jgi:hypothetical protein